MALVHNYANGADMASPNSRLSQMQARFQQRQLHEKEQKMLAMLETQQQRTIQRVGRGSAGSTGSTSSVTSNGGKVRQMLEEKRANGQNNNGNVGKAKYPSGTKGSPVGWDKSYPLDPIDRSWGAPRGNRVGITVSHATNNRGVSLDRSAAAAAQKTTIRRTRSQHQVQNNEEEILTNGNYHQMNGRRNGAPQHKTAVSTRHSIAAMDANANRYAFEDDVDEPDELSTSTRSLSKRLANVGLKNKNVETNGVSSESLNQPQEELEIERRQEVDIRNGQPDSPPSEQPELVEDIFAEKPPFLVDSDILPIVEPVPPPRRRESQPTKKPVAKSKPAVTRRTSRTTAAPVTKNSRSSGGANTNNSTPASPTSPPAAKSPPGEMFIPLNEDGKGRGRGPPQRQQGPPQRQQEQASTSKQSQNRGVPPFAGPQTQSSNSLPGRVPSRGPQSPTTPTASAKPSVYRGVAPFSQPTPSSAAQHEKPSQAQVRGAPSQQIRSGAASSGKPSVYRGVAPFTGGGPQTQGDLLNCPICGRHFIPDRLEVHISICSKTAKKKRKVFDSTVKRVKGTEAEPFVRRALRNPPPPPEQQKRNPQKRKPSNAPVASSKSSSTGESEAKPPNNWRKKHEDFIRAIREAKKVQAHLAAGGKLSDLPPPPPSDNSDYIQCPYCNRRFNQTAAERHIPRCKDIINKPKPPPKQVPMNRRR